MKRYEIRSKDLKRIFLSFEGWWELSSAQTIFRSDYKNQPETDLRHGSVLIEHEYETDAEADKARLDWLEQQRHMSINMTDFKTIREAIDAYRQAPPPKVTIIES